MSRSIIVPGTAARGPSSKIPKYSHWGVTISIYASKSRFSAQFVLNGQDRHRIEKASEFAALQAAKRKVEELLGRDPTLPLEERCASEILASHGMSLLEAARLIDTQTKLLEPTQASIADAVAFFLKQNLGTKATVATVVQELILKKSRECGVHHLADLKSRLENRFSQDFGTRSINAITGPEIAK